MATVPGGGLVNPARHAFFRSDAMLFLKAIEPTPLHDGMMFRVTLEMHSGTHTLTASPSELQAYAAFQRVVLERLAMVYQLPSAEGRAPEVADHFWLNEVEFHLHRSRDRAKPATA